MTERLLIILFCILFYSCKDRLPAGIINQPKMQQVLWDLLRADALSEQIVLKDSSKSRVQENALITKNILVIHQITEDDFKKSYAYYVLIKHQPLINPIKPAAFWVG